MLKKKENPCTFPDTGLPQAPPSQLLPRVTDAQLATSLSSTFFCTNKDLSVSQMREIQKAVNRPSHRADHWTPRGPGASVPAPASILFVFLSCPCFHSAIRSSKPGWHSASALPGRGARVQRPYTARTHSRPKSAVKQCSLPQTRGIRGAMEDRVLSAYCVFSVIKLWYIYSFSTTPLGIIHWTEAQTG